MPKRVRTTCNICYVENVELKCNLCTFECCFDCINEWSKHSVKCPQCSQEKTYDIEYEVESLDENENENENNDFTDDSTDISDEIYSFYEETIYYDHIFDILEEFVLGSHNYVFTNHGIPTYTSEISDMPDTPNQPDQPDQPDTHSV